MFDYGSPGRYRVDRRAVLVTPQRYALAASAISVITDGRADQVLPRFTRPLRKGHRCAPARASPASRSTRRCRARSGCCVRSTPLQWPAAPAACSSAMLARYLPPCHRPHAGGPSQTAHGALRSDLATEAAEHGPRFFPAASAFFVRSDMRSASSSATMAMMPTVRRFAFGMSAQTKSAPLSRRLTRNAALRLNRSSLAITRGPRRLEPKARPPDRIGRLLTAGRCSACAGHGAPRSDGRAGPPRK